MLLLQQMTALFLMMLIGYLCGKMGALDVAASKKISWLVINVGNPAMILAAGMDNESPVEMQKILLVVGLSLAIYGALLL
ncbi:MAG: AEC family transporter, partial [Roseburia sp.]|nr:AEC family transporter [Roseburia sp.]